MADAFPETRWTKIVAARGSPELRRAVLDELCASRWQPLYVHLRKQGLPPDRAQDVVQGFLVHLLERDFLARLDPGRGRLRAYLKTALAHYLANLYAEESAQKRGGGRAALPFDDVEAIIPAAPDDPEAAFDREWALGLFEAALTALEAELASGARRGPVSVVRSLFRFGEAAPYEALAAEHGMTVPQLKSFVFRARGRFRELLLARIADTVHTPQEAEAELADLLKALDRVTAVSACPRCGTVDASGRLSVCPRCLLAEVVGGAGAGAGALPGALPNLGADGLVLEAELGRGGMGRVFRARDERLGRAVAVKVLRPESAANPDFRARFAREARLLAQLEHPGIVAVHDFGTTPAGDGYLVMQLVSGGSIAGRLPLPIADALAIAVELCAALAYAHGRGIIHRDIKPENVLIGDDGRARLSDFGIARLVNPTPTPEDGPLTRPSMVLGTPGYMAPEARAGARPDPRMDIYAVGALLAHMLTGRHPDAAAADADVGLPISAGAATPHVPAAIAAVIARATAVDPARRPADAKMLGDDLAALAAQFKATPRMALDLPPEERVWRGAVALLAAVATAVALYAALVSLTPRTMAADDAIPFTAFGSETLANGRVLTRARFEVWPTLGATVAIAIALAAYGLLRRHWRAAGLERPAPDRPLAGSRRVLRFGIGLFALFLLGELARRQGAVAVATYIPVVGGCLELIMLYRFWDAALEARQTSRSLTREPLLWLGLALSLFPPTYSTMALLIGGFGR